MIDQPKDEPNQADVIRAKIKEWIEAFERLRRQIGTPFAVLCGLIFISIVIWWNWDDIKNKPGVRSVVSWFVETIEYLYPAPRVAEFTVQFQNFGATLNASAADTVRVWSWAGHRWNETPPNGNAMFHSFFRRMSLDGCAGDQTQKDDDKRLEMFIPYHGCNDMTLHYRYDKGTWLPFGAMLNVK